jgi:hypothetical protein
MRLQAIPGRRDGTPRRTSAPDGQMSGAAGGDADSLEFPNWTISAPVFARMADTARLGAV